jgi:hypothetical protein
LKSFPVITSVKKRQISQVFNLDIPQVVEGHQQSTGEAPATSTFAASCKHAVAVAVAVVVIYSVSSFDYRNCCS